MGSEKKSSNKWLLILITLLVLSVLLNLIVFLRKKGHKSKTTIGRIGRDVLTTQENKILDAILSDQSNKEIAAELFVSHSTVKTHVNSIYKKLKVQSRDEIKQLFNK